MFFKIFVLWEGGKGFDKCLFGVKYLEFIRDFKVFKRRKDWFVRNSWI